MASLRPLSFLIVAGAIACCAGASAAKTLSVGQGAQYGTIAAALAKAKAGDTIEVSSGTYPESISVPGKVILRGVDTGNGLPIIMPGKAPFAIHLSRGRSTVENIVVSGREPKVGTLSIAELIRKDAGILVESDGNALSGIIVRGLTNGVVMFGSGNTVASSRFEENAVSGMSIRSGGRNSVSGSDFLANGIYGLQLGWLNDPALATGDMSGWYKVLRSLKPVEANTVSDNRMRDNGFAGLVLSQAAFRNTVSGNAASANGGRISGNEKQWIRGAGILLSCGAMENIIADNDVRENDNVGISVDPGMDNRFEANTIASNSEIGINVSASTGNTFTANIVSAHRDYGMILKRWDERLMPNADNLIHANDLFANGINAFDDSGIPFEPPSILVFVDEKSRKLAIAKHSIPNRWDDGERGNHFDDFDETSEGFSDADGDGVGETAHPIPGGAAVDRHPLAAGIVTGLFEVRQKSTLIAYNPADACVDPTAMCGAGGAACAR